MQNIRLTIQYDGTRYLGWSRPEKDGRHKSISYKIEEILKKQTGEDIILYGGAKTDPGVHALAQTANFRTASSLSPCHFRSVLNEYLPKDIAVLNAETAPERFRADLNAVRRTYQYRIYTAPVYDVFAAGYQTHIFPEPDINAMKQAAAFLPGKRDFSVFSPVRKKKGTVKELFDISVRRTGNLIILYITADDFLFQMPAVIAGTLLEAGLGLRSPESVRDIFTGTEKAGAPLDAQGLLLQNIQY